jgi:fused signal recognition particle receptor
MGDVGPVLPSPPFSPIPDLMFSLWKKKKPVDAPAAPVPPPQEAPPPQPEPAGPDLATPVEDSSGAPASWRERLGGGGFARNFGALFGRRPELDEDLLDDIETAMLGSDAGVVATESVMAELRRRMHKGEFADSTALLATLRGLLVGMLRGVGQPLDIATGAKPFVLLVIGVNGVGKTTTIGKLARRFADERKSVMLAAGDTFRAAAVEQLQTWGERNQVPVIAQGEGADSASVIYDALQAARSRGTDLLIADTAGRLHTQAGLMDELSKVKRVLAKLDPAAPHEVLLVIDGNTGQNAVNQVRQFHKAIGVTGLVVTKLDGTAKGGVIFALAREFGLPIRFVGLGEKIHDLRAFDPDAFVDALLPPSLAG